MPDEVQSRRPCGAGRTRWTGGTSAAWLACRSLRASGPLRACGTLRTRAAHERDYRDGGETWIVGERPQTIADVLQK